MASKRINFHGDDILVSKFMGNFQKKIINISNTLTSPSVKLTNLDSLVRYLSMEAQLISDIIFQELHILSIERDIERVLSF